jgi:phytanoyl-CoA hydroxylase
MPADLHEALAHYREHGWARLGPVVDEPTLAGLRERLDALMLGTHRIPGLFFQPDSDTGRYEDLTFAGGDWRGPSLAYRKLEKLERDDRFRAVLEHPVYAQVARAWYGAPVSLYRAVVFNKAAGGGTALPWHQDGGRFWGIDRQPTLQLWLAIDDAPIEAGCVEIVPGTHHGGLATPQGGTIPADVVARAGAVVDQRRILVPARAGEVLLIHNLVWHRSGVNTTPTPRRALTACLMDAATRCLRKKHAPRDFTRLF